MSTVFPHAAVIASGVRMRQVQKAKGLPADAPKKIEFSLGQIRAAVKATRLCMEDSALEAYAKCRQEEWYALQHKLWPSLVRFFRNQDPPDYSHPHPDILTREFLTATGIFSTDSDLQAARKIFSSFNGFSPSLIDAITRADSILNSVPNGSDSAAAFLTIDVAYHLGLLDK